jgi:hypothetical protein
VDALQALAARSSARGAPPPLFPPPPLPCRLPRVRLFGLSASGECSPAAAAASRGHVRGFVRGFVPAARPRGAGTCLLPWLRRESAPQVLREAKGMLLRTLHEQRAVYQQVARPCSRGGPLTRA